ncbi:MAG: RdgB/HAM1 family non-canonical purine NTP pyrophosphatase [Acholeplasma sp.]|nr:RdgB/HAM1 family non-canonical purine NTP pyrophosphatase [Acholeplasma sp.]
MRLLVATQNEHKKKEIQEILKDHFEIVSLKDLQDYDEVDETKDTFFENALLKASYFAKKHQMLTLADDTGLCVDALNGAPGVLSQRYSGLGDESNIDLLLDELKDSSNREAYFMTVLVLYNPKDLRYQSFKGRLEGVILKERRGQNGFGYDSVFFLPEHNKTLAEMDEHEKNSLSHRALALETLKEALS